MGPESNQCGWSTEWGARMEKGLNGGGRDGGVPIGHGEDLAMLWASRGLFPSVPVSPLILS